MAEYNEREVIRQETTTGQPVTPVTPVAPVAGVRTSRTDIYRSGAGNERVAQVVWWVVGLIDTLIAIRFLLKMFGASTASAFVSFMYALTDPLVAPFHGIFNTASQGRSVFEPESVVAIIIYTLIGWGIVSLIRLMARNRTKTTVVD
ncbi:MAG: YggT family protein [Candidatus Dormibacteraeota bacterium]|nr:YggT family protein [Candidatus Dormibacteraeota bacterium]